MQSFMTKLGLYYGIEMFGGGLFSIPSNQRDPPIHAKYTQELFIFIVISGPFLVGVSPFSRQ